MTNEILHPSVPPGTVCDEGELALVQSLAGQVLGSANQPAGLSAKLQHAKQAVARLLVKNSIRAAVYHTVQTTVLGTAKQEEPQ